jgi:deoxyinosine 3'endonuclease (endonuclease V)
VFDKDGRQIAEILSLPMSSKVIYVSVGHKISLKDAVGLVRRCLSPRGPVPISLAHDEVTKQKWLIKKSGQVSS